MATRTTRATADTDEKGEKYDGFTAAERDAMKERAKELKSTARRGKAKVDTEVELLAKIAEMTDEERVLAEGIHAIVKAAAPHLTPKTWYGMPAYAKDGKVVCFFQPASKFKARYSTLGFNDPATLDDGTMWPTAYALTALTPENEAAITALIAKAAS